MIEQELSIDGPGKDSINSVELEELRGNISTTNTDTTLSEDDAESSIQRKYEKRGKWFMLA